MKRSLILSVLLIFSFCLRAEKPVKKGYNLGVLPAVSYNSDLGLQYGAILNLFDYGDGRHYPAYDHSAYLELSKYTKGSGVLRMYYDSEKLIKGIRSFLELSYLTDDLMDFYGFNGYQSYYSESTVKANRAFYKMSQKQIRLLADFKGKLPANNLYWIASYNLENYRMGTVHFDKLNEGLQPGDPEYLTGANLYSNYVTLGLIHPDEAKGNLLNSFKAGLVYDSRPTLNNPEKGMLSEALIEAAPALLNELPYFRYSLMHSQFQTIFKDKLIAAIRLGAQGQIGHQNVPFYRRTQMMSPFAKRTNVTGLGGCSSLRGILRNRVVGDAFAYGNFELRWKVVKFRFINQNFYAGINGFFDTGLILDPVDWDENRLANRTGTYIDVQAKDGFHSSTGGGIKLSMNENFILSAEMGKALDERDGEKLSTYINLNYLF